ncbi:SAM-dependent methyltransferase [Streptomyces sp. GKU 257-1]|nr:SAM-dependent methyltransferase [Streptomyces sp. GKU 257-1]
MTAADPIHHLGAVKPHSARMYDYFLGGKSNYEADRQAAALSLTALPNIMIAARHNRGFMHRAVRYLAREHGIRQFLDIGTGIPTTPNLHQVAQTADPTARVVYSDNDPIVLAHARALMNSTPQGATSYIEADVRDPEVITEHAAKTLDFTQPIALSLVALLHFIEDADGPRELVKTLMGPLPAGSALILSHATADLDPDAEEVARIYRERGITLHVRPRNSVTELFTGLEQIEPGIVPSCDWKPDYVPDDEIPTLPGTVSPADVSVYAGVGIKR